MLMQVRETQERPLMQESEREAMMLMRVRETEDRPSTHGREREEMMPTCGRERGEIVDVRE